MWRTAASMSRAMATPSARAASTVVAFAMRVKISSGMETRSSFFMNSALRVLVSGQMPATTGMRQCSILRRNSSSSRISNTGWVTANSAPASTVAAMRRALDAAGVDGGQLAALALDTTGSSVIPVGERMAPLDDYYLWCDHRAKGEAAEIPAAGRREKLEALEWCGGVYSSEWGFSKLLHWLRANPDKRTRMVTALEHCDMVAAVLCGITDARQAPRSVCAMGHKWMWNRELGG